jgi:hypothetical protein
MTTLNLNELSGRLIQSFLPVAVCRQNLLVNEVPADIYIDADRDLAASVLSGLIQPMITQTTNSCIRLSAKIFDNLVLLNVTDGSGHHNCGVVEGLRAVNTEYIPRTAA